MTASAEGADRAALGQTALAALVWPTPPADFLKRIWERGWARLGGPGQRLWLLEAIDLPALLDAYRDPALKPIAMGRMMRGRYHRQLPYRDAGLPDLDAVERLWRAGYSLIAPELHLCWPPARAFCRLLEAQSGLRAEINLYYTPPGAIAFPPHHDTHDVVVAQIFGRKTWRLGRPRARLPFPDERWDPSTPKPPPLQAKLTLARGDMLYLPRGLVHSAAALARPSLHLSIGLYPLLWRDALAETGGGAVDGPVLRRGVSPLLRGDPRAEHLPPAIRRGAADLPRLLARLSLAAPPAI